MDVTSWIRLKALRYMATVLVGRRTTVQENNWNNVVLARSVSMLERVKTLCDITKGKLKGLLFRVSGDRTPQPGVVAGPSGLQVEQEVAALLGIFSSKAVNRGLKILFPGDRLRNY